MALILSAGWLLLRSAGAESDIWVPELDVAAVHAAWHRTSHHHEVTEAGYSEACLY